MLLAFDLPTQNSLNIIIFRYKGSYIIVIILTSERGLKQLFQILRELLSKWLLFICSRYNDMYRTHVYTTQVDN